MTNNKQTVSNKKIEFLSDFREQHDKRVNFCRMLCNMTIPKFEEKRVIAENFLKKLVDSCDFCMCMPPKNFEQALKDDEIKEIFEIGQGATVGGIKTRRAAIKQLYGLDSEKYPVKEMPKYGILVGAQKQKDLLRDPDIFYHYGIVMLTFKKERLLNRTTMTVGASLQFVESLLKTPTFVTDPKFVCIKGVPKDQEMLKKGFFMGINFFVDKLLGEDQLSVDMPNRMSEFANEVPGFENFELQYFGKMTISEDVKEVCYMPLGSREEEEIAKLKPLLDKYGLECKELGM